MSAPNNVVGSVELMMDGPAELADFSELASEVEVQRNDVATELAQQYAKYYALPFFDPPDDAPLPIDPGIAGTLPSGWCFRNQVAPLSDDGKTVEVAVVSPDSLLLADEIRRLTGRQMQPLFATVTVMDRLIDTLYGDELAASEAPVVTAPAEANEQPVVEPLAKSAVCEEGERTSPAINPLSHILRPLVQEVVTQIVIEPHQHAFRVRARGPKGMYVLQRLSRVEGNEIIDQVRSRLNLSDSERSRLQSESCSGEFRVRLRSKRVSIFASFCPGTSGTMLNLTRTISCSAPVAIDKLGLQRSQLELVRDVLQKQSGLIVLAGPRQSGKTTTLYSMLAELNDPSRLICTLEDSMSIPCEGINQLSLSKHSKIDKKSAIDSVARQSPDVIAIDKLDCPEVARAAMHEAAMGRLVIATIECADSATTSVRLQQLGFGERELSDLLAAVISHRRVNRLCRKCSKSRPIDPNDAERLGLDVDMVVSSPQGCSSCRDSGFDGSLVAFEVSQAGQTCKPRIADVVASHLLAGTVAADSLCSPADVLLA